MKQSILSSLDNCPVKQHSSRKCKVRFLGQFPKLEFWSCIYFEPMLFFLFDCVVMFTWVGLMRIPIYAKGSFSRITMAYQVSSNLSQICENHLGMS